MMFRTFRAWSYFRGISQVTEIILSAPDLLNCETNATKFEGAGRLQQVQFPHAGPQTFTPNCDFHGTLDDQLGFDATQIGCDIPFYGNHSGAMMIPLGFYDPSVAHLIPSLPPAARRQEHVGTQVFGEGVGEDQRRFNMAWPWRQHRKNTNSNTPLKAWFNHQQMWFDNV